MNSAIERLLGLRVKDIMNGTVVTVAESDDMQVAADRLAKAEVSGAPVVNSAGQCVGVISANDFVARDAGHHEVHILTRNTPEDAYQVASLNDNLVSTHMSPVVQTVSEEASIVNAGRVMCHEGIHRLVVVDAANRPKGIISTLDLVAAVVSSVEE